MHPAVYKDCQLNSRDLDGTHTPSIGPSVSDLVAENTASTAERDSSRSQFQGWVNSDVEGPSQRTLLNDQADIESWFSEAGVPRESSGGEERCWNGHPAEYSRGVANAPVADLAPILLLPAVCHERRTEDPTWEEPSTQVARRVPPTYSGCDTGDIPPENDFMQSVGREKEVMSDSGESGTDVPSDSELPPRAPPSGPPRTGLLSSILQPEQHHQFPRPVRPAMFHALQPTRVVGGVPLPQWEAQFQCHARDARGVQKIRHPAEEEEDEWLNRQRLTGAVAKLVKYHEGECPGEDILKMRSSTKGRIIVRHLLSDGPAAQAGVVPGDQLACIDGVRDFALAKAEVMLRDLRGPATLIFLGFVGKLQAEVRVKQPDRPRCGMSPDVAICDHTPHEAELYVQQCDTVVFTREPPQSVMIASEMDSEQVMYEIRRNDARALLHGALLVEQPHDQPESDQPPQRALLGQSIDFRSDVPRCIVPPPANADSSRDHGLGTGTVMAEYYTMRGVHDHAYVQLAHRGVRPVVRHRWSEAPLADMAVNSFGDSKRAEINLSI